MGEVTLQEDTVFASRVVPFNGHGGGFPSGLVAVDFQVPQFCVGYSLPSKMDAEPIPVPRVMDHAVLYDPGEGDAHGGSDTRGCRPGRELGATSATASATASRVWLRGGYEEWFR